MYKQITVQNFVKYLHKNNSIFIYICITVQECLLPNKNTIHNGLERYDKTIYGEMSVRQKVSRWSVLTAKCVYGEVSLRPSVLTAKSPHGETSSRRSVPTTKCPHGELFCGEKTYGEKSGHDMYVMIVIVNCDIWGFWRLKCRYIVFFVL